MSGLPPYEVVIGLEVHVELKTRSKIFCGCPTEFGAEPNTQVCPVCLGLPGVLPVLNRRALEQAVRAALALNCEINRRTRFDRKNYHYPDLPKGYQISQYALPIGERGWLTIGHGESERRIRIRRVHLEEDTGKLLHDPLTGSTLVDFNRAGVPLLEIVSEADLRSPEEAREYLAKLRAILAYADVSDVRMEEGSLRVDCNVSVRPRGSDRLGTKVEVKNLNSFRAVVRALAYEAERQWQVLQRGGVVEQETRHWDERRGITFPSRSKEEAHDYRYFPEPDLVPVVLDEAWLERLRASLPELPDQRRARYVAELGLPAYDAAVLTAERAVADYFERALAAYAGEAADRAARAKAVANWVMGEVLGALHERGIPIEAFPVTPERLAELLRLVDEGVISGRLAKEVFAEMAERGESAAAIVERRGLRLIRDEQQLQAVVDRVIADNPAAVADFLAGKEKAIGRLVGEVMRHTRGQADPQLVQRLLRARLAERTPSGA